MPFEAIKTLHIIAIISWMAGLLYLPRLFVYHAQVPSSSARDDMLQTMERRLYKYIMTPAMVVAWGCGVALLAHYGAVANAPWVFVKLAAVVLLTAVHYMCGWHVKQFAAKKNQRAHKYFRIFNEVPTLLMVVIIIAVVYKF